MIDNAHKMALETLLAVAREQSPELPEELIRNIYAIQRRHQFDRDRTESVEEVRQCIEAYVASLASTLAGGGTR